jgi:hypothetical protein
VTDNLLVPLKSSIGKSAAVGRLRRLLPITTPRFARPPPANYDRGRAPQHTRRAAAKRPAALRGARASARAMPYDVRTAANKSKHDPNVRLIDLFVDSG